jgi:hypothetical protein
MEQETLSRAINRRRPEEQAIVLSLRDDILGVPDSSNAPEGERRQTPAQRFAESLWDKRYALYDRGGEWVGQGVPFNLRDFGILKNRCAERIWRLTGTIQGDGLSNREPGAPIMILKRNTFASQWCSNLGNGEKYQWSRIQPSRHLFREFDVGGQLGETEQFSVASIYPFFNVRRNEFYRQMYQEGASEELAGRGLYGDYILMFPREMLLGETFQITNQPGEPGEIVSCSSSDVNPNACAPFPLGKVEDVLLRFDYLSVDNFGGLSNTSL